MNLASEGFTSSACCKLKLGPNSQTLKTDLQTRQQRILSRCALQKTGPLNISGPVSFQGQPVGRIDHTASSACFRSPMMSVMSSVPTDRRTKSGVTPVAFCSSEVNC